MTFTILGSVIMPSFDVMKCYDEPEYEQLTYSSVSILIAFRVEFKIRRVIRIRV